MLRGCARHRARRHCRERKLADGPRPRRSVDAAGEAGHGASRHCVFRHRSDRGDDGTRQLYRVARRHCGRARHCACRRQAGRRIIDTLGLCSAAYGRRRQFSGRRRHRCAARTRLPAGFQSRRPQLHDAAARAACAKRCRRRPQLRPASSARPRTRSPPGCREPTLRPLPSMRATRPILPGWRGWAPSCRKVSRRRSRNICVHRTRSRKTPLNFRADDELRHPSACPRPSQGSPKRGERDAAAIAAVHAASFQRGWGEDEFHRLLADRNVIAHRAMVGATIDRVHPVAPGRRRGGNSVGCRSHRLGAAAAFARPLLDLHLRRLAGLGARAVFLEVGEHNTPAGRLYRRAGFHEVGRRQGYYDGGATALVLRRDLG